MNFLQDVITGFFMIFGFTVVLIMAACYAIECYVQSREPKTEHPSDIVNREFDNIIRQ